MIKKKQLIYFFMFLVIALSNTVFFGIEYRGIFLMVAVVSIIGCIAWYCHSEKSDQFYRLTWNNIYICATFAILLICGWLFSGEMSNSSFRNAYIGFIIAFLLSLFVTEFFSKIQIVISYVNWMFWISIVSLICFAMSLLLPGLVYAIPMKMSENGYFYSIFYTWGWDNYGTGLYLLNRNCGPFWEPGAFQGFLVVALLMCVKFGNYIKAIDKKILVLLVTLLTTLSTTGLLLFVLICVVWRKEFGYYLLKNRKNQKMIKIVLVVVFAAIALWLLFSGIITDKLATYSDPTASTGIRLMDLVNGIGLCAVRPIFGMGFGTTMIKAYENAVGIGGNSNGIILMFYAMGSIFGVVYLYLMSKGVISFFEEKNKIKKIIYVVIFVILQATECIFIFPVYILFLYEHNGEKANEERRRSISFADILTRINDTLRRKKNGIEE